MPTESTKNRLVSVKQAADELGVHRATVHKWIAEGSLPSGSVLHIHGTYRLWIDKVIQYGEREYGRRARRGR